MPSKDNPPIWKRAADELHDIEYYSTPRSELLALLKMDPNRVLDLGCGIGATGRELKLRYRDAEVIGVERNTQAAKLAQAILDDVIVADLDDFEVALNPLVGDRSFDTILVADILEHVYNPWRLLVFIKKLLGRESQIIASIPNTQNIGIIEDLIRGKWTYVEQGLLDFTHIRFFTRTSIESLFRETGFTIEELHRRSDGVTPDFPITENVPINLDLVNLVLKNVSREKWKDFQALQFVLRAVPDDIAD